MSPESPDLRGHRLAGRRRLLREAGLSPLFFEFAATRRGILGSARRRLIGGAKPEKKR
jgi:hypothetical protein